MPKTLTSLVSYCDELGNEIINPENHIAPEMNISFAGNGNRLAITEGAMLRKITAEFRGSNAAINIGA